MEKEELDKSDEELLKQINDMITDSLADEEKVYQKVLGENDWNLEKEK